MMNTERWMEMTVTDVRIPVCFLICMDARTLYSGWLVCFSLVFFIVVNLLWRA